MNQHIELRTSRSDPDPQFIHTVAAAVAPYDHFVPLDALSSTDPASFIVYGSIALPSRMGGYKRYLYSTTPFRIGDRLITLESTILIIRENHLKTPSVVGSAAAPSCGDGDLLQAPGVWLAGRLTNAVFEMLYSPQMGPLIPSLEVEQALLHSEIMQEPPGSKKDSESSLIRLNGAAIAQVLRDQFVLWVHLNLSSSKGSASNDGSWDFRQFVLDHGVFLQCHGCSRKEQFCNWYHFYLRAGICQCFWKNCQRLKLQDGRLVDADLARVSPTEQAEKEILALPLEC